MEDMGQEQRRYGTSRNDIPNIIWVSRSHLYLGTQMCLTLGLGDVESN